MINLVWWKMLILQHEMKCYLWKFQPEKRAQIFHPCCFFFQLSFLLKLSTRAFFERLKLCLKRNINSSTCPKNWNFHKMFNLVFSNSIFGDHFILEHLQILNSACLSSPRTIPLEAFSVLIFYDSIHLRIWSQGGA
jgi:hypothetical protein